MPLLRRQPFVKIKPPDNLQPDEEVFFCPLTEEIFRDYELFFERIILCNSLVWTCELTGRPGLTYQEALLCEARARDQLQSLPKCLEKVLLHLASLTHRSRLNHLNDDIFGYCKDRLFMGETVELIYDNEKLTGKITNITAPESVANNDSSDSDVVCLDDDPKPKQPSVEVDINEVTYIVQSSKKQHTLRRKHLSRKKGLLTRDKCKLFLKQHCDPHGDGIWKVKQRHSKKWDLPNVKFTSYFVGAPPSFTVSEVKKKPSAHVQKQSTATAHSEDDLIRKAKELRQQNKEAKKARNQLQKAQVESASKMTLEEKIALYEKVKAEKMAEKAAQREQIKKLLEEQKAQRKEDLAKERERRKEEKRIQEAFLREYNRPRDDLLCDDLQDLPKPTELNLPVASHVFGDVMMVLEYLKAFSALFDLEEDFPNGINLGDFCQALQSTEINGLYYDIIQFLLTAIIRLQDEEDQESGENHFQYNITKADTSETLTSNHKCYDFVMNSVNCAQKPFKCYGKCLDQLQLDSYTITEVLRLFLLGSCARSCNQTGVKFRYQQRGGYNFMDDVGLDLVKNNSDLVNKLDTSNIFDISAEDKLQVTTALINQLLSYVGCRDTLDENIEQLRQVKADLRSLQLAEQKREKDESAYRYKKRLEERANEMERAKLLAQGLPIPKELQPVPQPTETKILDLPEEEAERSSTRNKKKTKEAEEIPKDIDWEKVTPEQKEKWKRIHQSKEKEILKSLVDLQQSCGITPLGRDRTFRRYWTFRSVPGLFVEDSEEHIEPEYFDQLVSQKCSVGKTETRNGDEKSGLCEKPAKNVPVSPKGETSGLVNGDVNGTAEDHPEAMDVECNDEKDTCEESTVSVQKQIENFKQVPWSVYHSKVDIELLIQRLNPRGYREGPLRTALFECKRDIILGVEDCPISLLSGGKKGNSKQQLVKVQSVKSRNKNTQGHVEDGSARELMELSLREQLLDIEERIFVGTLGALKNVDNREAWRNALENGSYNATGDATLPINEVDSTDEKHDSLVVADLSRALCQIYDAVEPKYLNVPLGENDPKKKKPLRSVKKLEPSSANNSECSTELASTMACRWLASLRECHSLSQIFLHLSALEGCIAWSKSALNARCRICRRKGDPDKMLLCDDCDRGHHMYCLKPPVKSIPRGDWFCPECKPKQKVVFTPRKARRKSMPDDVDMEEESDEEEDADSADDEDESSEAESDDENDSNDTGDDMEDGDEEDTEGHSSADDSQEDLDTDHEPSPKETKIKIFGKKRARKLDYSSSGRSTPTSVGRKSAQSSRASTPTITESRASRGSRPAAKTTNSAAGVGENKNSRSSGRAAAKRTYAEVVQGDVNGNPSKRLSSSRSAADSLSDHMNACKQLVKKLADHKDSNFFMFPVSSRDVPDYHEIVKRPMDLGTVRVKMNNYTYSSARELIEDIKLVFSNCELYNQPSSPVYQSGQRLCEYFVKTLKELKLHTLMSGKSSTPSSIPNGDGRSRRSGSRRSY